MVRSTAVFIQFHLRNTMIATARAEQVRAAENDGTLVHGQRGAIVEGTAGNTGIGLALAGRARG